MNNNIFKNMGTYMDVYVYLLTGPKSRNDLLKYLQKEKGSETTAKKHTAQAFDGNLSLISIVDEKAVLDMDGLLAFLVEVSAALGQEATLVPKKKRKPEDNIASVKSGHSPQFTQMQDELNVAKAESTRLLRELEQKNAEIAELRRGQVSELAKVIATEMEKKVLIPATVKSEPPDILAKDFFYSNPVKELDASDLVSDKGGELDSLYQFHREPELVLNEKNYLRRICKRFKSGELFRKRLEDQEQLQERMETVPDSLDRNRIKSINLLLADKDMDNQTKLSTYAFWYFHDDPEMEELLNFAGSHSINANYVIQLMEKPAEFRNYRTMRAFLKQVQMASEASIKRATAQELLCGDWEVVADYCGKPCHFHLLPVEELVAFKELLLHENFSKAVEKLESVLQSTSGPLDQKSKEISGVDEKKSTDILTPDFLHAMEHGVNTHVAVDESVAMDDFADHEIHDDAGEEELPF